MLQPSSLLACCERLAVLFDRAGYEVFPPLVLTSLDLGEGEIQLNLRNPLGAGGYQEILIELMSSNICRVFTGEIRPRTGVAPTRPWRRAECALDTPDLGQILLTKVREMLLDEF